MPNLVGIWNPSMSQEEVRKTLKNQLQRVTVAGVASSEYLFVIQGFGVAFQDTGINDNGVQPAIIEEQKSALFLDGQINNSAELHHEFGKALSLPEEYSTPELCLRLITARGIGVARLFDGAFCIVHYDGLRNKATLVTDRYGARTLFYLQRGTALIFATEMKAITRVDPARRTYDDVGTLELFTYATQFMGNTWLQGYYRLTPATALEISSAGIVPRRYWSYAYDEQAKALDTQTYTSVFAILLDRAVERCMSGRSRIGVFLSGGYDSRAVAAAIRKYHQPIPAFTFGLPESRDVRFAAILAERLGLEHHWLAREGSYLYPNCRFIVWRTEGLLPFSNTTSIHFHAVIKQHIDIILTGFLGEFSGSHTWPELLLTRTRRGTRNAIFKRYVADRLESVRELFNTSFFDRTSQALRERFEKSFEQIENNHPLNVADAWNLTNIQPNGTFHAPAIDRHKFEMRAPLMDYELVDFLLTIPPYARLEQRLYKKMIAYSFPAIRDVPCTNSGRPIEPRFLKEYSAMAARYVGRRIAAPFNHLLGRNPSLHREFRDLNSDFRDERELADDILYPLLRSGVFPSAVFRQEAIERLIQDHYEKRAANYLSLSLLISWGLANKYFVEDDISEVPQTPFSADLRSPEFDPRTGSDE